MLVGLKLFWMLDLSDGLGKRMPGVSGEDPEFVGMSGVLHEVRR